jgi:hypothetical protein
MPFWSAKEAIDRWEKLKGQQLDFAEIFHSSENKVSALDQDLIAEQMHLLKKLTCVPEEQWEFVAASVGLGLLLFRAKDYATTPVRKYRYHTPRPELAMCAFDRRSVFAAFGANDDFLTRGMKRSSLYLMTDYVRRDIDLQTYEGFLRTNTPRILVDKFLTVADVLKLELSKREQLNWGLLLNNFSRRKQPETEEEHADLERDLVAFALDLRLFLGKEELEPLGDRINYPLANGFPQLFTKAKAVYEIGKEYGLTRMEALRVANQPKNLPLFMARFKFKHDKDSALHPKDFQWQMTEATKQTLIWARELFPKEFHDAEWLHDFFDINFLKEQKFAKRNGFFQEMAQFLQKISQIDSRAKPLPAFSLVTHCFRYRSILRGEDHEVLGLLDEIESGGITNVDEVNAVLNLSFCLADDSTDAEESRTIINRFFDWHSSFRAQLASRGFTFVQVCALYVFLEDRQLAFDEYAAGVIKNNRDRIVARTLEKFFNTAIEATWRRKDTSEHMITVPGIKGALQDIESLFKNPNGDAVLGRLHSFSQSLATTQHHYEIPAGKRYTSVRFIGPLGSEYENNLEQFLDFFEIHPQMIIPFCVKRDGVHEFRVTHMDALMRTFARTDSSNPKLNFLTKYDIDFPFSRVPLSILKEMYELDSENGHTPKPKALVLMAKEDWNGALGARHSVLKRLQRTHSVIVHEIGKPEEGIRRVVEIEKALERMHSCVILSGHGDADGIIMATSISSPSEQIRLLLSRTNVEILKELQPVLGSHCALIIDSCESDSKGAQILRETEEYTLYGPKHEDTFRQVIERTLPDARVFASRHKGGLDIIDVDPHTDMVTGAHFIPLPTPR